MVGFILLLNDQINYQKTFPTIVLRWFVKSMAKLGTLRLFVGITQSLNIFLDHHVSYNHSMMVCQIYDKIRHYAFVCLHKTNLAYTPQSCHLAIAMVVDQVIPPLDLDH